MMLWLMVLGAQAGVPGRVLLADSVSAPDDVDQQSNLQRQWTEARLAAARSGTAEAVQLPLAFRSMGWGCPCPTVYMGTMLDLHTGGAWLSLTYEEGLTPPSPPTTGLVVVAEGHFTGKPQVLDKQPAGESVPELIYNLEGFKVTSWRAWTPGGEDDWLIVRPPPASGTQP